MFKLIITFNAKVAEINPYEHVYCDKVSQSLLVVDEPEKKLSEIRVQ